MKRQGRFFGFFLDILVFAAVCAATLKIVASRARIASALPKKSNRASEIEMRAVFHVLAVHVISGEVLT